MLATKNLIIGSATFSTANLAVGSHVITETFTDGTNFITSSATSTVIIGQDSTRGGFIVANQPGLRPSVTLTATIAGVHSTTKPTGTVTFYSGATMLGTGTLSNGKATLATKALGVGADSITVVYGGDPNFLTGAAQSC